jgi:Gluconate 2-dehydrogenase subunit 3
MNRRELFKRVASVAVAPAVAFGQQHVHEFPDFSQMSAPPANPNWKPEFFTEHENTTVIAVSELIIPQTDTPGAKAAFVNRYMDLLLSVDPPEDKERFRSGLKSLDEISMQRNGKVFIDSPPGEQTKTLEALEAKKEPFFGYVKGFTTQIYYATKPGFLELNKGGRVPDTFGCTDAEHKR